jgi:adenosine kinase
MFSGAELERFIEQASWLAVNDYEWGMLAQKTGLTTAQVAARVEALIVTKGAEGSVIHADGRALAVPCAKPRAVVDPTGCGDAYRAGLIHGLLHDLDWQATGRLASLLGAIKIESRGPQNHVFTRAEFLQRYVENFGLVPKGI